MIVKVYMIPSRFDAGLVIDDNENSLSSFDTIRIIRISSEYIVMIIGNFSTSLLPLCFFLH